MTNYKYNKGLYKCSEEVFYKKVDNLKEMVRIYKSAKYNEVDKAYQLFKMYNTVAEFDQKYRLLLENGSNDSMLKDIYEYIPLISDLLRRYRDKGYEKDFYDIRTLERRLDGYEEAKTIIFDYLESNLFEDEHIFDELGITSLEFDKCISKIKSLAPNLYKQYLAKRELNIKLKYNDAIYNFMDIANAIESGYFEDGTKFSMLEFWARVPLKENLKNEYKNYQKINPNLEDCATSFISRVIKFTKVTLPIEKHNTIISFLMKNNILSTSKTMILIELRHRYNNLKKIIKNGEEVIEISFCEEDFVNIVEYMKIRRLPFILEVYEIVWLEYIKGNISKESINEMKNTKIKQRGI